MNKNKYILLLFALILSMIVGSCKKKKPPAGIYYIGTFKYNYPNWPDEIVYYKITDTNEDYFLIGRCDYLGNLFSARRDTIYKDKKKEVHGKLSSYGPVPYDIKGKWSYKLFSNEYIIEGDFTQTDYTHGGVFTYSGTFVIKSKGKKL